MDASSVYQLAVEISHDYLGPAAERFLQRQIQFHLQKDPSDLTVDDLPELSEWVKVSISVLTEDKDLVDDFANRILNLTDGVYDKQVK